MYVPKSLTVSCKRGLPQLCCFLAYRPDAIYRRISADYSLLNYEKYIINKKEKQQHLFDMIDRYD